MSKYEIGKDIQQIHARLEALERNACQGLEPGARDEDRAILTEPLEVFAKALVVTADGQVHENVPAGWGRPDPALLKAYLTGGGRRWETGFPDFRKKSSYGGTIWLQHRETGEKLVFHYIQTGSHTLCNITFGDTSRAYSEARDTHVCGFGIREVPGHPPFSSWGKFRYADGTGYNVPLWSVYC